MLPKTITQNLLLWGAAFAIAVLLSALASIAENWPAGAGIDWRAVCLDVIKTILTTVPIIAAGFGLPRLGREPISALVNEVGAPQAKAALEVEAIRQATGVAGPPAPPQMPSAQEIAAALEDEREKRRQERNMKRLHEVASDGVHAGVQRG